MRRFLIPVMAFSILILSGCDGKKEKAPADNSTETTIVADTTANDSTLNKFTDFTMNDTEGNPVAVIDEIAKHKITIVDFWASWCGPCRAEMPSLVKLYAEEKDNGLGIVGVSLDNDLSSWERAIEKDGITWLQVSDLQGWENAAARMYEVNSIPHTILVNANGEIVSEGLRGEELAEFVKNYLE